jgi:hypothetical protein
LRPLASPCILPKTLTGLAGRILLPLLAGVGPKKKHIASPGGQYATSPKETTSRGFSVPHVTGISKYISSPHVFALPSIGNLLQIASAVSVLSSVNSAVIEPAEAVIIFMIFAKLSAALILCFTLSGIAFYRLRGVYG